MNIKILHLDDHYVVVDKPSGLLVHRTRISDDKIFLLQILRDQIGKKLFPVHRLDRPTSGVIVFALNKEAARLFSDQIQEGSIDKKYIAIVRGYTQLNQIIDHDLKDDKDKEAKKAVTEIKRLATAEYNIPNDRYKTSRYSLIEASPRTGRYHQIRKHCASISHHIVGDTVYGKGLHNRIYRENFGISRLLLQALSIRFYHPYSDNYIVVKASLNEGFKNILGYQEWKFDEKSLSWI